STCETAPRGTKCVFRFPTWRARCPRRRSGEAKKVQRGGVRRHRRAADGRDRSYVSLTCGTDEALGGVFESPRARKPAGAVRRRDARARKRARRRARALPRVPLARDRGKARADAGLDRPALQAPALTTGLRV